MFRFEDKTPYYLNNNSRDFQLMNRLMDSTFMGQRGDIQTILNLNSPHKCKNSMLDLLAKKVGFFTDKYIDDNVLRHIISSFQAAVKHKGTQFGIMQAVIAILKAENSIEKPQVNINGQDLDRSSNSYQVQIFTPIQIINRVALEEFLKYVIPIGWTYTIQAYQKAEKPHQTIMTGTDKVTYIQTVDTIPSVIRSAVNEFNGSGPTLAELEEELANTADYETEKIKQLQNQIQRRKYLDTLLITGNEIIGSVDVGMISDRDSFVKIVNQNMVNENNTSSLLSQTLDTLKYQRTTPESNIIIEDNGASETIYLDTTNSDKVTKDSTIMNQVNSDSEEVYKNE